MLASSTPSSFLLSSQSRNLASSSARTKLPRFVNLGKGMNLARNISGFESSRAVGFCGCGRSGFAAVRCGKGFVGDGDLDLEAEVMEFMKKSRKPGAFPSKKELNEAGRLDLVLRIKQEGGWMALGWDLDDDDDELIVSSSSGSSLVGKDWEGIMAKENDLAAPELRSYLAESSRDNGSVDFGTGSSSSSAATLSGGTWNVNGEEATGIEGILSRLEKQRSAALSISHREKEIIDHALGNNGGNAPATGDVTNVIVAGHDRRSNIGNKNNLETMSWNSVSSSIVDSLVGNPTEDMRQNLSKQRTGLSNSEFKAVDLSFNSNNVLTPTNASLDELLSTTERTSKPLDRRKDISTERNSTGFIRTRLQSLELELSSALLSIRSNNNESTSVKAGEETSEDVHNLSDAWEFQQTNIMHAQDKLRSLRAKLAVLEGKMALAIIDAQKIAEEKQKKIDNARRALYLLRTIYIVWPNSASEVLLAGSFDGWTTQRRMEKSPTGIFSLGLKLYPGVYEIKFIVDGIWRIDPLRPIAHNNCFENNILTVT